ncbi:ABC transporter ATP-binding protein [Streptomyces viridochromogenes DSM 40736]|uniref:ABC transporter ATP-binding protein n=1 Tax=Streptomyces viridochromogenes (strain DSM 40736 / JCM 4977 / BCRC 1201 / Tue 494) TaxID=591159 RepID=D9WZ31_STRVT|nr:ABC transporter ATP-binding protein [Streptomyces viridochromogenes DSM 40736]
MIQAFGLTSNPRKELPPAADDVSFEARAGRVTALLGAPGAGKTTVLRLMLELQQGRGVTYFRGRPLHRMAHPSREVGVLLGEVPGHPGRTVRGHLRMLCAAAGVSVRRADEALETVGLGSLRDERLGTLSRGMDRRLGLACALLADPHTLVLDDPADRLSSRESNWLHGMLRAHAAEGGTVLFTTADPKEAARAADRVVTLEQGKLVADQEAAEFSRTRLRPRVAVRSPHAARLGALLAKQARTAQRSVEVVHEDGNRLSVYGSSCADIGETAFRHGIVVHQLADEIGDMGPGAGVARKGGPHGGRDRGRVSAGWGADEWHQTSAVRTSANGEPHTDDEPTHATDAHRATATRPGSPDVPASPRDASGEAAAAAAAEPWPTLTLRLKGVAPEPVGGELRPDADVLERAAVEQRPTSGASEPATSGTSEPATSGTSEPATSGTPEPADDGPHPAAVTPEPPAGEQCPAADTSEAFVDDEPPAPQQPAAAEQHPTSDTPEPFVDEPLPSAGHAQPAAMSHGGPDVPAGGPVGSAAVTPQADSAGPPHLANGHTANPARRLDALPPLPPPISVRPAPSPLRPLRYEIRRAAGIGTGFLTGAVVLLVSAVTAVVLARIGHTPQPRLLAAWPRELPLPPAALGAGLLGALAFGDEFRHPALAADRGTVPRRLGLLAAKLLVASVTALALAVLAVGCDAEVLYLVYGRELVQVPSDWLSLSTSWVGLVVGCAWAGVLAAGVFRSTTAGLAAVAAVPLLVVPLVHKVLAGPSVRTAAGLPLRLREVLLPRWPFGGERYLEAALGAISQPVGGALTLSLTALLCAYLLTTLRSRLR